MLRLHGNEIVVVGNLPAGFAAGIETRITLCALPVKCQQPEALALIPGRYFSTHGYPVLQDFFARPKQVLGRCLEIAGRRWRVKNGLELCQASHPRPFSLRNFIESDTFSCTPTFFALRPNAMPSNCVK